MLDPMDLDSPETGKLARGGSAALIGISLLFIATMMSIGPKNLTDSLHVALLLFAFAIPFSGVALLLSTSKEVSRIAMLAFVLAASLVCYGIVAVLYYLYPAAGIAFFVVTLLLSLIPARFLMFFWKRQKYLEQQRKLNPNTEQS